MAMSTTPSTRPLSEVARELVYPHGITTSVFPRVSRRLSSVGVSFDAWQSGFGTVALGCREDGRYAATIGGVVASIPRQVGKTFTVGNLLVGMALEFPGLRVAWTSHHNNTTSNTFRSIQGLVRKPKIYAHLDRTARSDGISAAHGQEAIRFKNGSYLMFGAREQGFGRGLDALDIEVFDEAQILTIKALEDMVPATNQARHRHGGLIFFLGTPPRPIDPGEAFTAKRDQALAAKDSGADPNMVYVEISADPDSAPDDRSQWPIMNPSFPHRTPVEAMLRMRANIPDDDSWNREARGIWPLKGLDVFSPESWDALRDRDADPPARVALTVAVAQDRSWACIAAAGDVGGRTLVMCHSMKGLGGVAAKVVEMCEKRDVSEVAIVGAQAKALQPDFAQAGVEFSAFTSGDEAASCVAFQEAVKTGAIIHLGQPELDLAVRNARTRLSGESERWDRRDMKIDDSPLIACSAAFYRWGLQEAPMPAIY